LHFKSNGKAPSNTMLVDSHCHLLDFGGELHAVVAPRKQPELRAVAVIAVDRQRLRSSTQ
jgi:hypothetical protein